MATLHVLQGPDKGRTYRTPNEPAVIGRSSDQIHLTDHSASRRHAELRPANGAWVLVDLNSSNGTYLNGQRVISPITLKHGDQIKVGSTVLVFTGKEDVEGFSGTQVIRDLLDVDMSSGTGESSILTAVDASEDSVILQPPETADAVVAWNVIFKIAENIGSIATVDALLERITDILFDHLIADRLVLLLRSDSGELVPQVVRSRTRDRSGQRIKIVTSRTITNHVLNTKDGVLCANAMTDDRFGGDNKQDSVHRLGLKSIICVPILVRDEVAGLFHLDCSMSRHTYTQEQLRLVVAIGRLAGMAIDNLRLQESRVQNERLAAAGETVAYLSHHIRNILQGMQGGADVVEFGLRKAAAIAASNSSASTPTASDAEQSHAISSNGQADSNALEKGQVVASPPQEGSISAISAAVRSVESGWSLIRRNLDRILVLTMNMLTFSKDRQPRIELAQLNKIVEDVIALVQGKADEHHVMILADLEEMPAVPLDPDGMHQVAHNIVLNAIEACGGVSGSGRVNITTKYQPGSARVTLSIGDNGPGIAPEERERIFAAFHSSKGQSGTGLGLAAARKIVAELNGQIEIDSTPGEGTTFYIRLPAVHVRLADADKTHAPA